MNQPKQLDPKLNIDQLAALLMFGLSDEKQQAFLQIWQLSQQAKIFPASIQELYALRAKGKVPLDFTVPAINLKGLTYDLAQTIFNKALELKVGAVILELARSEMGYTLQSPYEYAGLVLAAAIKTGYSGPVFIQGDHFHFRVDQNQDNFQQELSEIKDLCLTALDAGFYNIDIDASTLVDYSQTQIKDQQQPNYSATAKLANYLRQHQPEDIEVSLGGEIGHIGGKNSTEEELRAFMIGFNDLLDQNSTGLSKISIQTGTHHGGVVLADGSLAEVNVDFEILKNLARVAREYEMGGTVQHGASTLPDQYFAQFPQAEAIEIHLATQFQNIIFDHPAFPLKLLKEMYNWLDEYKAQEKKPDQTPEQFYYQTRKYLWGPFKQKLWELPAEVKQELCGAVGKKVAMLFEQLNVVDTKEMVEQAVTAIVTKPKLSNFQQQIEKYQQTEKKVDFSSDPD